MGALAFETVSFAQSKFPILAKSLEPFSRKSLFESIFQHFSALIAPKMESKTGFFENPARSVLSFITLEVQNAIFCTGQPNCPQAHQHQLINIYRSIEGIFQNGGTF